MSGAGEGVLKVFMLTYDHGPYIRQAIESVLMQQVDLPLVLVIGEDHSTDDTRRIVVEMAERYPDRIKPILHEERLGLARTGFDVWEECLRDSAYVAMLDGDDYWTDPLKLQKQLDVLRADPAVSMCFTNAWNLMPDGKRVDYVRAWLGDGPLRDRYTTADIIARNFVPWVGVMLRNTQHLRLMERLKGCSVLDHTINVVLSLQGPLAFIDGIMGVRRVHAGGMMNIPRQASIDFNLGLIADLDKLADHRYSALLAARRRELIDEGFRAAVAEGNFAAARRRWRQMVRWMRASGYSFRELLRDLTVSHFTGAARWWARYRTARGS